MAMGILDEIDSDVRPWGNFITYCLNKKATVKILTINKGESLSLQSHKNRHELWIPLDHMLEVEIDNRVYRPKAHEHMLIEKGMKHRGHAPHETSRILEISFGHFDEDDEVRHEDKYGRLQPPPLREE